MRFDVPESIEGVRLDSLINWHIDALDEEGIPSPITIDPDDLQELNPVGTMKPYTAKPYEARR